MHYRKDNWANKLNEFIESRRSIPFEWGVNDCSLFAADAVQAITGVDVAKDFRNKYSSMIGANKLIKSFGSLEALADACLIQLRAFKTTSGLLARGDVVLVKLKNGNEALGINLGRTCAFAGANGVEFIPFSAVKLGWGVL